MIPTWRRRSSIVLHAYPAHPRPMSSLCGMAPFEGSKLPKMGDGCRLCKRCMRCIEDWSIITRLGRRMGAKQ